VTTGLFAATRKISAMKILLAAAAASLALVLGSPMALAEGARPSSTNTIAQTREPLPSTGQMSPHYEWRYHYVGRHARMEGYWVPVR
jgi:hypothetical protein